MSISAGDSFLFRAPLDKFHLHIVVEEVIDSGTCICAFISSIVPGRGYDKACVLDAGDSSFITHPSYVVYDKLRFFDIAMLEKMLDDGTAIRKERIKDDVLRRIRQGAIDSKMTPNYFRKYFADGADM